MPEKTVTLKVRDLIIWGLVIGLLLFGAFQIIMVKADLQIARYIVQGQQNAQNIQALDRALADLVKQVEELRKAK